MALFHDRVDAGKQLSNSLMDYANQPDVIVLALPRGGVPIGFEVAKALKVPLDVFLVRKIGVPWQKELAMGAIASGGVQVFNEDIIQQLNISKSDIQEVIDKEQAVLEEREHRYREGRPFSDIADKIVLLVDDGIATGATISAAIKAIKKLACKKLVIATPVAPADTCERLRSGVDDVICLQMPEPFYAIGSWYDSFPQTSDDEVMLLLSRSDTG